MDKKEPIKISISTFILVIILICMIIGGGVYIYISNKEKQKCENQIQNLEQQVKTFENTIKDLEKTYNENKNIITEQKKTIESKTTENTTTDILENTNTTNSKKNTIEGRFKPVDIPFGDPPDYVFYTDGRVELQGNAIQKGTYNIEGNIIKIKYTMQISPEGQEETINETDKLKIVDNNTLLDEANNSRYMK